LPGSRSFSVSLNGSIVKRLPLRIFFAVILSAGQIWSASKQSASIDIGGATLLTYNSAWSQTTSTNWGLGFGLASQVTLPLGRDSFSLLFNITKSQSFSQRIDGAKNEAICSESYSPEIFKMPGACSMIQVRLSPLYWFHNLGLGISIVYNYFSDITYNGAEIYNTKRSNQALGPVIAFKQTWNRFTLLGALHFEYAIFSQSPLANPSVKSLQAGVTLYAMYAIF
jgi:hypothetical protein